ncbi:MAG: hydroxyacylglutathione hydrolase [Bordetella sp.]|nr:MAG: hydroxyacylglutathione hydrolase [Bordetella sp.]
MKNYTLNSLDQNSKIFPLQAFSDNYIWVITHKNSAAVIDPGQAKPVTEFLYLNGLKLKAILLTHFHDDHISGVEELISNNRITVYGPSVEKNLLPFCNILLKGGDIVNLTDLNTYLNVLDVPGHTQGHIAYYGRVGEDSNALFPGDTLFSGGCGRVFNGTTFQLFKSLELLSNLPVSTKIYSGHEYTINNLRWAMVVDPDNIYLKKYYEKVNYLKKEGLPTLPSSIQTELEINPFFRTWNLSIAKSASLKANKKLNTKFRIFTELRKWKDKY